MFKKSFRGTEHSLLWTWFTLGGKPLVGVNNALIFKEIFFLVFQWWKKKNLHLVKCEVGQSKIRECSVILSEQGLNVCTVNAPPTSGSLKQNV